MLNSGSWPKIIGCGYSTGRKRGVGRESCGRAAVKQGWPNLSRLRGHVREPRPVIRVSGSDIKVGRAELGTQDEDAITDIDA